MPAGSPGGAASGARSCTGGAGESRAAKNALTGQALVDYKCSQYPAGGALAGPSSNSEILQGGTQPMKIRPLHDRLLVERLEEKEVKKGGIIIPGHGQGEAPRGQGDRRRQRQGYRRG